MTIRKLTVPFRPYSMAEHRKRLEKAFSRTFNTEDYQMGGEIPYNCADNTFDFSNGLRVIACREAISEIPLTTIHVAGVAWQSMDVLLDGAYRDLQSVMKMEQGDEALLRAQALAFLTVGAWAGITHNVDDNKRIYYSASKRVPQFRCNTLSVRHNTAFPYFVADCVTPISPTDQFTQESMAHLTCAAQLDSEGGDAWVIHCGHFLTVASEPPQPDGGHACVTFNID